MNNPNPLLRQFFFLLLITVAMISLPACNQSPNDAIAMIPVDAKLSANNVQSFPRSDSERNKTIKKLEDEIAKLDQQESERKLGFVETIRRGLSHARLLVFEVDIPTHLPAAMRDVNEASKYLDEITATFNISYGDNWPVRAHANFASLQRDLRRPLEPLVIYYKFKGPADGYKAIQRLVEASLEQSIRHAERGCTKIRENSNLTQFQPELLREHVDVSRLFLGLLVERAGFRATFGNIAAAREDLALVFEFIDREFDAITDIQKPGNAETTAILDYYHKQLTQYKVEIKEHATSIGRSGNRELEVSPKLSAKKSNESRQQIVHAIKEFDSVGLVRLLAVVNDLDSPVDSGGTCLGIAIEANNYDALRALLVAGADANKADRVGRRPLDIAMEQQDILHVGFLLKYGANCQLPNTLGETPCQILRKDQNFDVPVTPQRFREHIHLCLKNQIEASLKELPGRLASARKLVFFGQQMVAENSGSVYPMEAPYQSTIVNSPSGTGTFKIDLTPSPLEFEQLRQIEEETAALEQSNGLETIKIGEAGIANVELDYLFVLFYAEVVWGIEDPEYRKVVERVRNVFAKKPTMPFDPNAFRRDDFRRPAEGYEIYSPPIVGGF